MPSSDYNSCTQRNSILRAIKGRTLLVTGGAGFIGVNFVRYWHQRYPKDTLVILDALTYAGHKESLCGILQESPDVYAALKSQDRRESPCLGGVYFYHGSIEDEPLVDRLFAYHRPTIVVNFAAETHVDRSIHDPDIFLRTNILGAHVLLKKALHYWRSDPYSKSRLPNGRGAEETVCSKSYRFHHISTDEVFGSLETPDDPPFTPQSPYDPRSPYAASKAAADHLVRSYGVTYGLPYTISHCANNYGPYQHPEKLIPLMISNILAGKPLPIYGTGDNRRDWLHVYDHCRALETILIHGKSGCSYGISGQQELSNIDLVHKICDCMHHRFYATKGVSGEDDAPLYQREGFHPRSLISFVADRPGHDKRYALEDPAMTSQHNLNWQPLYAFEKGLEETIDWYLSNKKWASEVLNKPAHKDWLHRQYSVASG